MELLLLSRSTNREMTKRKKKGGAAKPGKLDEEGVEKRERKGGEWGREGGRERVR